MKKQDSNRKKVIYRFGLLTAISAAVALVAMGCAGYPMQEYNSLMGIQNKAQVNSEINAMADSLWGNGNGHASAHERNVALGKLESALNKAADEWGNRDGTTSSMERQRYIQNHSSDPLVQILTGIEPESAEKKKSAGS